MRVNDALDLPSFAQANVIAGEGGLENEITSVMILEATDIENWSRRGQLIITSFYALQHLSEAALAAFFRTMSTIGISAVAFKPERLYPDAPAQILELCDDFDLPLIRLSPQVKYEAILLDVMGHILDSNLTLLNRYYNAHQHFMALALKQPSIPYILSTLKNTLHADVTFLDATRDRRHGTDLARTKFVAYSFDRREPMPYQAHAYFDAVLYYEPYKPHRKQKAAGSADKAGAGAATKALAARIPSSDGADYYLLIHDSERSLTALDSMTVENIVSLLQMEILKQNAIKQKLFFQNNNAVHDLLLDRCGTREKVDSALTMLGIDRYASYETLLVRVSLVDPADIDRLDELRQAIRRRIRTMHPGIVYYENDDRLVFLHNFRSPLSRINLADVNSALDGLHALSTLPLFYHLVAQSSIADRYNLAAINDEVLKVYRLFSGSSHKNRCVRFEDLGVYKLLLRASSPSELDSLIDPRLTSLRRESPDLFETVVALCRNGLDFARTADELYVHPKTIRYRLRRVQEICGLDVKNPDDFLQAIITDKILSLGGGEVGE